MPEGKPKREAPWSVRGVAQEARSAAALAAKKAGQSPGEWLTRVILDSASAELKHSREVGPTQEQMLAQLVESVSKLSAEVEGLKQQPASFWGRVFGTPSAARVNTEKNTAGKCTKWSTIW
jgi:hypothetical protein